MVGRDQDRLLIRAIVASQFAPPFMFSAVAVALPKMAVTLNAGATALSLIETLFLAGSVAFLLPVGRLADASDKRSLYKIGLLGFGLCSISIGLLSWLPAILLLRFLQGVCSAIFAATGPAILAELVPPSERGRAFGNVLAANYAGLTLGPICAGLLIDLWGWRAVFLTGATILLIGSLLIQLLLKSHWRWPTEPINLPSLILLIGAVLLLVAGSSILRSGLVGYLYLAGGITLTGLFILLQLRLPRPLIDIGALINNRVLRNALFVQLLLYMNAFCSIFMLSIYLQFSLKQSAQTTGQLLAIGTIVMALLAPLAGWLADRYRARLISSVGVAAILLTALLAIRLDQHSRLPLIALILSLQGVGFGLFSSPNMTIIINSVPTNQISLASAFGAKARSLGMILGMLVTALLISLKIGNAPIEQDPSAFIAIMMTSFTILAALTTLALLTCLLTRTAR